MKEIQALLWIGAFWRETPILSWKEWPLPVMLWAPGSVISMSAEYPLAIKRLVKAISQAEEEVFWERISWVANSVLKSGSNKEPVPLSVARDGHDQFHPRQPGMPALGLPIQRKRPVDRPTNINNVRHWPISLSHSLWPGEICFDGYKESRGTKVFALAGSVKIPDWWRCPWHHPAGNNLDIGGGIKDNKQFKGVLIRGPREAVSANNSLISR